MRSWFLEQHGGQTRTIKNTIKKDFIPTTEKNSPLLTDEQLKEAKALAMIHLLNLRSIKELVSVRLHDTPLLEETSLRLALDELESSYQTIQHKYDKNDTNFLKLFTN